MMVDPTMQIDTQLGKPDVFTVYCGKCTGEFTIHGKREILEACLISEGWVRQGAYMVCPRCPGARDPIRLHNHSNEKRRAAC